MSIGDDTYVMQGVLKDALKKINLSTDWSEGDLLGTRVTTPPAAHKLDFRDGSQTSPVKIGVSASLSRFDATTRAEVNAMGPVGTDGPDGATTFRSSIKGLAGSQVQIVAGSFMAWHTGESNGGEASPDAGALLARARVTNNGVGRAIPLYLESSRETATSAGQQGLEIRVLNSSGASDSYVANAPSKSMGIWINAGSAGTADSAAAFQIGKGFSRQFDVGYAANEGAIINAAFRDDSSAKKSLFIKGSHEEGAIFVENGAGAIVANNNFLQFAERATPSVAPADGARLYIKDNGSGKTQLAVIFATGAEIILATQA